MMTFCTKLRRVLEDPRGQAVERRLPELIGLGTGLPGPPKELSGTARSETLVSVSF